MRFSRLGLVGGGVALVVLSAALLFYAPGRSPTDAARAAKTPAPPATVVAASANPPPRPRQYLETATPEEWLAALKHRLESGASSDEILADLRYMVRQHPSEALDLALALARSGEEKYTWVSALLADWTAIDPGAAWTRAVDMSRNSVVIGEIDVRSVVLSRLAQIDPDRVVSLADATILPSADPSGADKQAVSDVAHFALLALVQAQHPELARRTLEHWAAGEAAGSLGNAAFEVVALDFAKRSRQDAAAWLESLPASRSRDFALGTLAADWASNAPADAMTWATSLENTPTRADAMQRVFNRWAATDIMAAVQWLGDHEAHPEADTLIANLVSDTSLSDVAPDRAIQWAALITDPADREKSVQQVLVRWAETDRDAALRFAESTPLLGDPIRQRTLEILRPHPAPAP